MDFVEYINNWAKSEVTQGRIMIGIGILFLFAIYGILQSQNELLRGAIIPLCLLVVILIGYGSYINYSRPAHVRESIAAYKSSKPQAIEQEKAKHINDNKSGTTLLKIYPILALIAVLGLIFAPSAYYKGMSIGFAIVFLATFVIDYGFVSRSDAFLDFLSVTTS